MENEARYEGAKLIKRIEGEAKENADKSSKKIIATAIQRYSGEFVELQNTYHLVCFGNFFFKHLGYNYFGGWLGKR